MGGGERKLEGRNITGEESKEEKKTKYENKNTDYSHSNLNYQCIQPIDHTLEVKEDYTLLKSPSFGMWVLQCTFNSSILNLSYCVEFCPGLSYPLLFPTSSIYMIQQYL